VLGLGFTGYLLPWDLKAYWATTVSTNIPKDIPIIGKSLSHLALGGDNISGATLTRFYAVHAMLLPALLVAFIAFHIYLVRAHGIAEEEVPATDGEPTKPEKVYRFYPEHLWRASIVFLIAFLILLALSKFATITPEPEAGTQVDSYLPRPEWYYMWLFQLLTYFPGKFEWVGSLVIPFLVVTLLFALPFLARKRKTQPLGVRNRPLPLAFGVTAIVGLVYLTFMGFAGAKPYGQTIAVPDRPLTPTEARGLSLYIDRDCAYCHQIQGQGGHRVGPDLSNEIAKRHSKDFLKRYIRDPQSINRTSVMPKYNLPDADLDALADFILALDFSKYPLKTVTKEQALAR
jgi:ubiquinol-cytochrome c reductase cytochrome b subunit